MLDKLVRNGVALAPWHLTPEQTAEVVAHLDQTQVWDAHVVAKTANPPKQALEVKAEGQWPMFSHKMVDIITAPHFFEKALASYEVAKGYFREEPVLYSMNCFWTQQGDGSKYPYTHVWHRDGDDRKQLCLFMYGTDVSDVEDGAHQYARGSHRKADGSLDALFDNPNVKDTAQVHTFLNQTLGYDSEHPPAEVVETVTGPAGTLFFSDPNGLHIGNRPAHKLRMLAWARWAVTVPPGAYYWDKTEPVSKELLGDRYPSDPALQHAARLIVR